MVDQFEATIPQLAPTRYEDKLNFPFLFFRGEPDKRYGIMPTRYRFSGQPDPLATTQERIGFETRCAAALEPYLRQHSTAPISDTVARAAARHFGAPSSFVDFSFNPEVAAFFAHPRLTDAERNRKKCGVIYGLRYSALDRLTGMQAWSLSPEGGRDIHGVIAFSVWSIPYLACDLANVRIHPATLTIAIPEHLVGRPMTIRTRLVPAIPRIMAQQGIFLEANFDRPEDWWSQVFLWTVLDFMTDKWCFLREASAYENAVGAITASQLFPPDDRPLERLTQGFTVWK
jgi:hypothetical protein